MIFEILLQNNFINSRERIKLDIRPLWDCLKPFFANSVGQE